MIENDNTIIRITNQGLKFEMSCESDRLVAQTQLLNLCVSNCFNQLDLLFSTWVSGCASKTNLHELCMHVSNCSHQISNPDYINWRFPTEQLDLPWIYQKLIYFQWASNTRSLFFCSKWNSLQGHLNVYKGFAPIILVCGVIVIIA